MEEPRDPDLAPMEAGESALDDDATWLEDRYVTLIEDETGSDESVVRHRGDDDTLRIWCPPR